VDDRSLVALARAGDLGAAGQLLARHQRAAYTAALRLLGEPAEAEDVAQDALVQAYTHLTDLRDGDDFGGWVRRIAVNRSLNLLRRRGRLRFESLDQPSPSAHGTTEGSGARREFEDERQPSPEVEALSAALRADVEALMQQLPVDQRVALVLRDVYDYDLAEIAALQRCGLSAAKMRVSRARATLRRLVTEARMLEADDGRGRSDVGEEVGDDVGHVPDPDAGPTGMAS
jgi:RNA polymerase sigma-70 factor (ECF subfamily)